MSHEIAHAVFSAREGAGWTGLGQTIPANIANDPAKIAELCSATYRVSKRDVIVAGTDFVIPQYQALVREDTGAVLHVASRTRYHVNERQPVEIFEAFRDELAKNNMEISHASVLKGGRLIAVSALIQGGDLMPPDGQVIKQYATLSTGYDGQHGTAATVDQCRVVCANTWRYNLDSAMSSGKYRSIRASQEIQPGQLSDLINLIGDPDTMERQRRTFDALANTRLDAVQVARLFADACRINLEDIDRVDAKGRPVVATKARNMLAALYASYNNAPGAEQGTAWGAFNAVTHFATHVRTTRDTTGDGSESSRVASNLFGDSAIMKARAMESLLALAA